MQLGSTRLTQEEWQHRFKEGRCFYCGESGHLVAACPAKTAQLNNRSTASGSSARVLTSIKVKHNTTAIALDILIDSGADERLMDWGLSKRLGLKIKTFAQPIKASALNGNALFNITHVTEPAVLSINNHTELMHFFLFYLPARTLVLEHPWLARHDPHIDWPTGKIMG